MIRLTSALCSLFGCESPSSWIAANQMYEAQNSYRGFVGGQLLSMVRFSSDMPIGTELLDGWIDNLTHYAWRSPHELWQLTYVSNLEVRYAFVMLNMRLQ